MKDSGLYFDNSKPTSTTTEAADPEVAKEFWRASEKLIGRTFDV